MSAQGRTSVLLRALRQALFIVVLGGVLGVVSNVIAPWGIPWVATPRLLVAAPDSLLTAVPGHGDAAPSGQVAAPLSITLSQARLLHDTGGAVFVDARAQYEYEDGCIAGAANIPYDEIEFYADDIAKLPRDSTIVVYCGGSSCDQSILLGDHLAQNGFRSVRVFFGGWVEWADAGYPVSRPH